MGTLRRSEESCCILDHTVDGPYEAELLLDDPAQEMRYLISGADARGLEYIKCWEEPYPLTHHVEATKCQ